MMAVNCYPVVLLTKVVLESFKKRWAAKQAKSLIVNSCAGASLAPMPYVQMFSATKVFCDFITEGLNFELKEFGVDVLGIRSFGLFDELHNKQAQSFYKRFFNVTQKECIQQSLNKCTSGLIFGAWQHEVIGVLI